MRWFLTLFVLAPLVLPGPLESQALSGRALTPACDSITTRPRRDTVPIYLTAFGEPLESVEAAHVLGLVVEDVLRRFEPPDAPFAPHWPHLWQRHDVLSYGEGGSLAAVQFTLRRDGSVPSLAPVQEIWNEVIEELLLRAVSAAVADRALPLIPPGVARDSLVVVLALRTDPAGAAAHAQVGEAAVPRWEATPVQVRRRPAPRHPVRNGVVIVRAIVEPRGVLDLDGVEVIRSDHPALTEAVLATLPRWRFEPARVDGCPVPQLVDIPVTFAGAP